MDDANESRSLKIACPECQQKLDLSDLPPFSRVECPACGADVIVPVWFDNYLLEEPIGNGGMADVYRALDLALDREVAIKILKPELDDRSGSRSQFFLREARTAATINHRSVVPIYNCGVSEGKTYIIMQFMSGGSLESRLRRANGSLGVREVAEWICSVAEGLDVALAHGIVHHDVKPGNILLDGDEHAKIGDFGLAQAVGSEPDDEPDSGGLRNWISPYYVSPEKVVRGTEGASGDIYSLGATFYHLLTGSPPFVCEDLQETIRMRLTEDPVPPERLRPAVGSRLSELTMDMLERSPENRPDYKEIIARINAALEDIEEREGAPREFQIREQPVYSYGRRSSGARIAWLLLILILVSAATIPIFLKDRRVVYDYAPYLAKVYGEIEEIPMARFKSIQNRFRLGKSEEAHALCLRIWEDSRASASERAMAAYFAGVASLLNSNPDAVSSIVELERGVKRLRDDAPPAEAGRIRPLLYAFSKMSGTGFEAQVFYQSPGDKARCELAAYLRAAYDGLSVSPQASRDLSRSLEEEDCGEWLRQTFLVRKALWDGVMGFASRDLTEAEKEGLEPLFQRIPIPTEGKDEASDSESSEASDSGESHSRERNRSRRRARGMNSNGGTSSRGRVDVRKGSPFGIPKEDTLRDKSSASPAAVVAAKFSPHALSSAVSNYRELGRPALKSLYSLSVEGMESYLSKLSAPQRAAESRRIRLLAGIPQYLEATTKNQACELKKDLAIPHDKRFPRGAAFRFADGLIYCKTDSKSQERSFGWDELPYELCLTILKNQAGDYIRLDSGASEYVLVADDDERAQSLVKDLIRCAVLALWRGEAETASSLARAAWKASPSAATERALEACLLD